MFNGVWARSSPQTPLNIYTTLRPGIVFIMYGDL
jgi:hypothetical protein